MTITKILATFTLLSAFAAASAFAADAPVASPVSTSSPVSASTPSTVSSPAPSSSTKTTTQVKPMTVRGSVVSIDASTRTLVIKVGKKDTTFQLGEVKPMGKDKKEMQLADLKAGSKVSGSAINKDGQEVLQSLNVQ